MDTVCFVFSWTKRRAWSPLWRSALQHDVLRVHNDVKVLISCWASLSPRAAPPPRLQSIDWHFTYGEYRFLPRDHRLPKRVAGRHTFVALLAASSAEQETFGALSSSCAWRVHSLANFAVDIRSESS